jgi:hypothetical protein
MDMAFLITLYFRPSIIGLFQKEEKASLQHWMLVIEEMDIEDLESMMEKTDRTDIKRVMTDLLDGSNSHLTAFETQIGYIIQ